MIKKYKMDVYPRTLYVAINESDESILKFLNGNDGDTICPMEESSNAYEMSVSDGTDGGALVRFRDLSKVTQGIVAHESFHAAMSFCDYLGINFDMKENNEHVAYIIQWIVNKVFETKWSMEG